MGISMSWLAAASRTPATLLTDLELVDTGEPARRGSAPVLGAALPDGGRLIVLDRSWHPLIRPRVLEHLSRDCRIVACTEDDAAHSARSALYREGKRIWQVEHRAGIGADHLAAAGRLPKACARLAAQAAAARRAGARHDVHLDIPARLARGACGIDWSVLDTLPLTVLRRAPADPYAPPLARGRILASYEEVEDDGRSPATLRETIVERLGPVLSPIGFRRIGFARDETQWSRADGELTMRIAAQADGPHFDLRFAIDHARVETLIDGVCADRRTNLPGTYAIPLSLLERGALGGFHAPGPAAFGAWLELVARRLPVHLKALGDLRFLLDAALRARPLDKVPDLLPRPRLALVAAAWLIDSPRLQPLVAACAPTAERQAQFAALLAHLRAHATPLG